MRMKARQAKGGSSKKAPRKFQNHWGYKACHRLQLRCMEYYLPLIGWHNLWNKPFTRKLTKTKFEGS